MDMQAIEFNAQVQNGIIKIPKRFKNFSNKHVKVIILDEEKDPYKEAQKALVEANQMAKEACLDQMTMEEINAEIKAYRRGE